MNCNSRLLLLVNWACLIVFGSPSPVPATVSITSTWEDSVANSDFIGVVECVVPGGVVATYKVIETWKGDPRRNEFVTLGAAFDSWKPEGAVSNYGREFVVAARKVYVTTMQGSTIMAGKVKLPWPDIPADYKYPLFWGRMPISNDSRVLLYLDDWEIDALRDIAITLPKLSQERQEELILRSLCEKYIDAARYQSLAKNSILNQDDLSAEREWRSSTQLRVDRAESTEEIVRLLLEVCDTRPQNCGEICFLLSLGGDRSL